jgi:hypothetical protein
MIDEREALAIQELACAIIRQAVDDYRGIGMAREKESVRRVEQERARYFLRGSSSFWMWCSIAGVNGEAVQRGVFGRIEAL